MNGWNVACKRHKCKNAYSRSLARCPYCGTRNRLRRKTATLKERIVIAANVN